MLNLMHLKEGDRLKLRSGAVGEVVENVGDGIWVQLRLISAPPEVGAAGDEELVHCEEIVGLADAT
jgi:hypothetical protein